ncbi:M48 family metallopeptidase [Sphingomonas flavalba]|uniref:M48 family metallopeptidase n=1 Tax=Sphingomonas flavalba TaxID=2559804 RepID=UPI0039DF818E
MAARRAIDGAVHGYVTHARRNRRYTLWLVAAYILAFELTGAFALTMVLLLVDPDHTILTNPAGYALRYALPLALLSNWLFWRLYRGHAASVTRRLGIRIVERAEEPRFVALAEEQCTALGVRLPRFGVIEADAPNAVTVGDGPYRGLIAVTRGLLDRLDDDELAAVLAHEASHIRQGDTRLLAANHALMRTAVLYQTHNPLRFEDWRQVVIPLLIPPMLLIMLAGGAVTMASMQLARFARRALRLGRDHGADGEAIRVTHFPEALISALEKVGGHGAFPGSYAVEGLLFDGPSDHDGGSHPPVAARIAAIATLGREMMNPQRRRRDTRAPRAAALPGFGRRGQAAARPALFPCDATGRPLEQPPTPTLAIAGLWFTNRAAYREWQAACIAWYEWRAGDRRNAAGLTPKLVIPLAAVSAFLIVFHWPADGDFGKLHRIFGPTMLVDLARDTHNGPFCSGPSYPDGTCTPGQISSTDGAARRQAPPPPPRAATAGHPPLLPPAVIPMALFLLILVAAFRPQWVRRLFGVVDDKGLADRLRHRAPPPAVPPPATGHQASSPSPQRSPPPSRPGTGFGRKPI